MLFSCFLLFLTSTALIYQTMPHTALLCLHSKQSLICSLSLLLWALISYVDPIGICHSRSLRMLSLRNKSENVIEWPCSLPFHLAIFASRDLPKVALLKPEIWGSIEALLLPKLIALHLEFVCFVRVSQAFFLLCIIAAKNLLGKEKILEIGSEMGFVWEDKL